MSEPRKKFVIKAFRSNVHMDVEQAKKIWADLRSAIHEIHNQNASVLSFEELYRNAYNLVLHKHGPLLYDGVVETVTEHLVEKVAAVAKSSDDQLLQELESKWYYHKTTMVMIRDILMYMDRTFVTQQNKQPIYDTGLSIFLNTIVRHDMVKDRLRNILLKNIELDRKGELIDRDLMRTILYMLVELSVSPKDPREVYEKDFEEAFLEATENFYKAEASDFISMSTCPDYMRKAQARLKEERMRAQQYLYKTTEPKLMRIVEKQFVEVHAKTLVDMPGSGCLSMFKDDKLDDLARLYQLFSRVPRTLDEVRTCLSEYIKDTGAELVSDSNEAYRAPKDFVKGLLDMRDKYEKIVNGSFEKDKGFQKTLKDSFEFFINQTPKCAMFLSLYVDDILKNKLKGICDDSQMDEQLDKVIVIFRYLQDKDVFESYYKQNLAKRLLSGRSVSDDAERNMIAKLKTECGYQFTSKLEGMFKDMKLSKELMEKFRHAIATGEIQYKFTRENFENSDLDGGEMEAPTGTTASGLSNSVAIVPHQVIGATLPELHVSVLTSGFWPTASVQPSILPAIMNQCCKIFSSFYLKAHNGRRLTWQTNMGNADMRAVFGNKTTHELNVSTYQMCILSLFNRTDSLTFTDILNMTNIPTTELKRHLISLAAPKFRILVKEPSGKTVSSDSIFRVNTKFKSKLFRVRVPLVSVREKLDAASASAIPETVDEDRRHLIEAAIVRIMKTRKQLPHTLLVAEVTKQLSSRFRPSPQQIKKRVESLIEREYLEREKEDRRVYLYLA